MAVYAESRKLHQAVDVCSELSCFVKQGALSGIIAGVVADIFIMAFSLISAGAPFGPARMVSGMLLGPKAMSPSYSLLIVVPIGIIIHFTLSIIFGMVFGGILAMAPSLRESSERIILLGTLFGIVLWVLNYHVLAPMFGWSWFEHSDQLVAFVDHTFFFGAVIGISMNHRVHPKHKQGSMR